MPRARRNMGARPAYNPHAGHTNRRRPAQTPKTKPSPQTMPAPQTKAAPQNTTPSGPHRQAGPSMASIFLQGIGFGAGSEIGHRAIGGAADTLRGPSNSDVALNQSTLGTENAPAPRSKDEDACFSGLKAYLACTKQASAEECAPMLEILKNTVCKDDQTTTFTNDFGQEKF